MKFNTYWGTPLFHKYISSFQEPNFEIDDMMIYEELDAIDYDSIDLYIDSPNPLVEDIFGESQSSS